MALEAAKGSATPSSWHAPRVIAVAFVLAAILAAVGVGVATYLTVVHYAHQPIACNGIGDCEYVNSSEYAELAGIPVALLGAGAYASILVLTALSWVRRDQGLLLAAWGIALASFWFSMYLTYIELRVLDAICVYCVVSATVVTLLLMSLTVAHWRSRYGDLWNDDDPAADL